VVVVCGCHRGLSGLAGHARGGVSRQRRVTETAETKRVKEGGREKGESEIE